MKKLVAEREEQLSSLIRTVGDKLTERIKDKKETRKT